MMASPDAAPSIENITAQERIESLLEAIEKLSAENKEIWRAVEQLSRDIAEDRKRLKTLEARPAPSQPPAKKHERKMKMVDAILVAHGNQPISFVDLGKLLGYPEETRRQNMTHLAKVFKANPEKYDVRESKLGGKIIKLNSAYHNHLTQGGV